MFHANGFLSYIFFLLKQSRDPHFLIRLAPFNNGNLTLNDSYTTKFVTRLLITFLPLGVIPCVSVSGPKPTLGPYYCLLYLYCCTVPSYCIYGQNGPLALIFEIFGPETLFGKYIGVYHFLWYSSLVSSSTPFFCSTVAPDVGIWNLKKSLVPKLMKLEYCSAMSPYYQHLNHMLPRA